jgi:hypothetical protein
MKKEYQVKPFRCLYGGNYGTSAGYFTVGSKIDEKNGVLYRGSWYGCRETFSRYFSAKSKILLMGTDSAIKINNCARFLADCETRLRIDKSKIISCNDNNGKPVVGVILNTWWTENLMRRQLLTVLLRAGQNYQGNFDKALESYVYSARTKEAIYKFFDGYTIFPKFRGGWVNNFAPIKRYGYYDGFHQRKEFNGHVERNLAKMQKDE